MRKFLFIVILSTAAKFSFAQCSTSDATGCRCNDSIQTDCDLLPDLTVSYHALADSGGYIEYPQKNAVSLYPGLSDDGKLRLSVAIPNIGMGPLESKAINYFTCGTDTSLGNPGVCPDGSQPKGLIVQKIYHKIQDSMAFYYLTAGAMTYHSLHGHFHVNDFSYYTLRIKKPGELNPLKWPVIGKTTKNGFCLTDEGNCSFAPGYCKDAKDSTLMDTDFANFGLGNYGGCTSIKQGISSGYYDEYFKEFYGMWIDIPPGTCNGNYYIVIQVDPLNHFLESNENNNVIAVPITLTKQEPAGNPVATIALQGSTRMCQGDSLLLTANGGYSYLWSTGDTVQTITVKQAGSYTVSVNSPCGTATSAPITVTVFPLPALATVTSDSICKGDSVLLKANGTDSLFWYKNAVTDIRIDTGTSYHTPPLMQSTTYYVENEKRISGLSFTSAKLDTVGGGKYYGPNGYMVFDCISPFMLNALTMYARDTGTIAIKLLDWDGYVLYSHIVKLVKGKNRVVLNLPVFKANNYLFTFAGDTILYGNNNNVNYPYTLTGVFSITSSTFSKNVYPFFYSWEVKTFDLMCSAGRVPVSAFVKNYCTVGINTYNLSPVQVKIFPNPFSESTAISLDGCTQGVLYDIHLYDLFGKEVTILSARSGNGTGKMEFVLKRNDLSPGIYFYKISAASSGKQGPELLYAGKIVVE
jgi:hypothetical protein